MRPDGSKAGFLNTRRREVTVCALLVLAVAFVYFRVAFFDFVNVDDETYVVRNPYIQDGLTLRAVAWAFTSMYASNWHPLTWLSHLTDMQLFKLRPGLHHLVNVVFHLLSSILLFLFLRFTTQSVTKSGVVAALFALHPLHVESVAWISERKDVLSTMLWMLTLLCYAWYARHPSLKRYLLAALVFSLGLMSKPMLVTLPLVLLLLDFWPLRRPALNVPLPNMRWGSLSGLLFEKLPLLALASMSASLTLVAQMSGGALSSLEHVSLGTRLANSLVSYNAYLWKMVWPVHLSVFYPLSKHISLVCTGLALLVVLLFSFTALVCIKKRPYYFVGWFWYVGTLVPVIGLVHVGSQSMADRYTYIPLIGIFIIVVWGLSDLVSGWRHGHRALRVIFFSVFMFLMCRAWIQVGYWKDSISLFSHAISVTGNNFFANNNLGCAFLKKGDIETAIHHYYETVRVSPRYGVAHANLALALEMRGEQEKALKHYYEAVRLGLGSAQAHCNVGKGLYKLGGDTNTAILELRRALALNPRLVEAWDNLGTCLVSQGKTAEGAYCYVTALRIDPGYTNAWANLSKIPEIEGRRDRYQ